jgi:selenocysteine lyase/cysteine desulfurase
MQHISDIENTEIQQRSDKLTAWLLKAVERYQDKKVISHKQFKKIPHLSFTQLNTQEINHYDIVRISDYIKEFFERIVTEKE